MNARTRRIDTGAWLGGPFLVGSALVVVVPLLGALALAFTDHNGVNGGWVGLANLRRMVGDDRWWASARFSVLFLAVAVPIRVGAATGLALLLSRRRRGVVGARVAAYTPSVLPEAALALVWVWLLNPLYGPLGAGLSELGLPTDELLTEPWGTRTSVVLVALPQIGEAFLIALVWRTSLGRSQYEAAEVAGASPLLVLRSITIPQMAPMLVVLIMRDVVVALQLGFTADLLVTDGGPRGSSTVVPFYLHETAFTHFRLGYASLLGVVALTATGVLAVAAVLLARRWRHRVDIWPV